MGVFLTCEMRKGVKVDIYYFAPLFLHIFTFQMPNKKEVSLIFIFFVVFFNLS